MFKLLVSSCLYGASIVAYAAPFIQSIQPEELAYGRSGIVQIQGQWQQPPAFALKPAGPTRDTFQALQHPVSLMASDGQRLSVITTDNQLQLLDPDLKHVAQISLKGKATALAMHKNTIAVAVAAKGLLIYTTDALHTGKPTYTTQKPITHLALDAHYAYLVLSQQTLQIIELSTMKPLGAITLNSSINHMQPVGDKLYFTGNKLMVGVIDIHNKQTPKLTRSFKGVTTGHAIRVRSPFAYVANDSGMVVLDITQKPIRWMGSHNKLGAITNVLFSEDRLVVNAHEQRLATLNIKNPELPITGSFYKPSKTTDAEAAIGKWVYLATSNGIERVDFSKSAKVQISNEGINQGGSRRAFVQDHLAYVADWFSGLHIYDMTDPKRPKHMANFHTPGSSKGVVVSDHIAYVGDDDHGLQILDVSDPSSPVKISEVLSTGLAYTMKKVNHLIYLADHRGGFHIIDVTDPHQPKIIGSYDTPGKSWAIDVKGTIAYVADDSSGLLIFDVSNPKQLKQIAQFNPEGYAEDVLIRDNKAYVSFFDKGLYILDISQPHNPRLIGHTAIPGNARSINLRGNYAYIAAWESGMQVVDVANPASPQIVAYLDTDGSAWGLDLDGPYAYLWDWWGGVKTVDISDPLSPHLIGQYHGRGIIENIAIQGNYLYSANLSGGMQVFDVKNALNPIWANGVDFDSEILGIWTNASHAYLAAGKNGLFRVDISDPFRVATQAKEWIPLHITSAHISQVKGYGKVLLARDLSQGLFAVDTEHHFTTQQIHDSTLTDFCADEHGVWISTQNQLQQLNVPNARTKPKLVNRHEFHGKTGIVRTHGNTVAVEEQHKGIHIFQLEKNTLVDRYFIPLQARVFDMNFDSTHLYIGSNSEGLLVFNISDGVKLIPPQFSALYPATSRMTAFTIHQDAAFFAGEKTIHSVSLLSNTRIDIDKNKAQVHIPAFMSMGEYQLVDLDSQGQIQQTTASFSIKMKKPKKPKFSMEDFKKIMKQKHLKSTVE